MSASGQENTTLAVPKEFAETLREEYDGRNDRERLENWALDCFESGYKDSISNRDLMEKLEGLENTVKGLEALTREDIDAVLRNYV